MKNSRHWWDVSFGLQTICYLLVVHCVIWRPFRLSKNWYEWYCWYSWFVRSTWARSCSRGYRGGRLRHFLRGCSHPARHKNWVFLVVRPWVAVGVQKMEDFLESDPEVGVKIIISPKAKGRRWNKVFHRDRRKAFPPEVWFGSNRL